MIHFIYQKEVLNVWPGVAHAPIGIKLNAQVFSESQQIPTKVHPDESVFGGIDKCKVRHTPTGV